MTMEDVELASAASTAPIKYAFAPLAIPLLIVGLLKFASPRPAWWWFVGMVAYWIPLWWYCAQLCRVRIVDGAFLVARNLTWVRVPFTAIHEVSEGARIAYRPVVLELTTPVPGVGARIVFLPRRGRAAHTLDPAEALEEMRNLVGIGARGA